MKKWEQNGQKVKRGNVVLDVGDYIDYHDRAGKDGTDLYDGRWQVLGADENGKLLIVSERSVNIHNFNAERTIKGAMKAYENGAEILNRICEIYAGGEDAISARSIKISDLNKVTGFEKDKYFEYGKYFTYHNKEGHTFIWHDGKKWHTAQNERDIMVRKDYYHYYVSNGMKISKETKAYKCLFGKDDKCYWLASNCVAATTYDLNFGLRFVFGGYVGGYDLLRYDGTNNSGCYGVRPVVTLNR